MTEQNEACGNVEQVARLAASEGISPELQDHILGDKRWSYNSEPVITILAANKDLTPESQAKILLETRYEYYSKKVLLNVAKNENLTSANQRLVWYGNPAIGDAYDPLRTNSESLRNALLGNPGLDSELRRELVHSDRVVRTALARSKDITPETLELLLEGGGQDVATDLARNPHVGADALVRIHQEFPDVGALLERPELPAEIVDAAVTRGHHLLNLAKNPALAPDQQVRVIELEVVRAARIRSIMATTPFLSGPDDVSAALMILEREELDESVMTALIACENHLLDQALVQHPSFVPDESMPAKLFRAFGPERLKEVVPDPDVRDLLPSWGGTLGGLLEATALTRR